MEISSLRWGLPEAVALLLIFVATTNGQRCPASKTVCVQKQYCLEKPGSGVYSCSMGNLGQGICCPKKKLPVNRNCTTSRNGLGHCVADGQCGGYSRDFLVQNKRDWWRESSNVCYQEKQTKYYCCPLNLQKRPPTFAPMKTVQPWDDNAFPTCKTTEHRFGRCVPMPLCYVFNIKLKRRHTDLNYKHLSDKYKCNLNVSDSTSVCCADPTAPESLIQHYKAAKLAPEKCGTIKPQDRIVGGKEAGLGEFPWMANLMYYRKEIKTTLCGGSLVHPRYVLTAAHCSKHGKPISVRLGEHDLSKTRDCVENVCAKPFKEYAVAEWIPHEEYKKKAGQSDIALVRLATAAKITEGHIVPICLPVTQQWLMTKPSKLIASGWGLTENERYSDVLLHTTLTTLVDRPHYCAKEQMICARGSKGEGHCSGDSGGPLQQIMRYGNQFRMVLFGVISGGAKRCSVEDRTAGVSVLVGYHMKWILDNMKI